MKFTKEELKDIQCLIENEIEANEEFLQSEVDLDEQDRKSLTEYNERMKELLAKVSAEL